MVAHVYSNTMKAEAGGLHVQGKAELYNKNLSQK